MLKPVGRVACGAIAVAACLLLLLCQTALAEYQGTPGKIAYVDGSGGIGATFPLKIWDPSAAEPMNPSSGITTPVSSTFRYVQPGAKEVINGEASTPVFSPDGSKIAYSALIPDPGIPRVPGYHTAIFVMNANGSGQHQLTYPVEALVPPECSERCPGHAISDFMPTWSPDGKTIAFIRRVDATEYDSMYPECCDNIWTIPAAGGTATQLTHGGASTSYASVVWGREGKVTAFTDSGGQQLGLVPEGASVPAVITSPTAAHEALNDYDVSPDGKQVTYTTTGAHGVSEHVIGINGAGEEILRTGLTTQLDRFSNTGNGPLRTDCKPQTGSGNVEFEQCGIFEEHTPNPDGDIRSDEPPDRFMLSWVDFGGAVNSTNPTRTLWDVQAQQLPIVFVPGFLGSEIYGCHEVEWFSYTPNLEGMTLEPNGLTNARCSDSAADGKVVKFYKATAEWIEEAFGASNSPFGCERAAVLGWDWRKAPQPNLQALDEKITAALSADECATKEGAKRVVIMAHSYGGLLTRTYIDQPQYAKRVARVLTVGTPYWGSPKSIFPPAYGIEMPYNKDNIIFNEEALKVFADNLTGLMQLFPSNKYVPWLTFNGETVGGIGARPFLTKIGVNSKLFGEAQENHDNIYDHFFTNYGAIDYRQVVGTGLATVGGVKITGTVGGSSKVHIDWVNGDGTVPGTAATTGPIGSQPPDTAVHIQDICGVEHMEETEYGELQFDYLHFLDYGHIPHKSPGSCPFSAGLFDFANSSGTLGAPSSAHVGAAGGGGRPAAASAGGPMSLEEAYLEDLIELYALPTETQVVEQASKPVTFGGQANNLTFTYTPISSAGEGTTLQYGPLTGALQISTGGEGVRVTLDGVPITGTPVRGEGEEPGASSAPGGTGSPQAQATPSAAGGPGAFTLRKIKVSPNGHIRLTLAVPGSGTVKARATLVQGHKRRHAKRRVVTYGAGRTMAHGPGVVSLTIKPGARAKAAIAKAKKTRVSLSVSFLPAAGAARTLHASAKVHRLRKRHPKRARARSHRSS